MEIWQANAYGKYAHPEDAQDKPVERFPALRPLSYRTQGGYRFNDHQACIVPGPGGAPQAPHSS